MQGKPNSRIKRQYRLCLTIDPVARMWLVSGDHKGRTRSVRTLDRECARRLGQALGIGRLASQAPAVDRAIDDDPS